MSDSKSTIHISIFVPPHIVTGEPGDPHSPDIQNLINALKAAGYYFTDYGMVDAKTDQFWCDSGAVELEFSENGPRHE